MTELPKLAREALDLYLKTGTRLKAQADSPLLAEPAACFVTLHNRYGDLRGCIGTLTPTMPHLADEIVSNAISAATRDPRFAPVQREELAALRISVDVLSEPQSATRETLDPKRYGVIVKKGFQRGVLLPDLDGVDEIEQQLAIACRKAGINPMGDYEIERFTVTRHEER